MENTPQDRHPENRAVARPCSDPVRRILRNPAGTTARRSPDFKGSIRAPKLPSMSQIESLTAFVFIGEMRNRAGGI
jgi:hypothetical protein